MIYIVGTTDLRCSLPYFTLCIRLQASGRKKHPGQTFMVKSYTLFKTQQQHHKLYLHDYNYVVTVLQKLYYKKKTNKQTNNHNNDNAMMTVVNQVSSA